LWQASQSLWQASRWWWQAWGLALKVADWSQLPVAGWVSVQTKEGWLEWTLALAWAWSAPGQGAGEHTALSLLVLGADLAQVSRGWGFPGALEHFPDDRYGTES
jgi:hypothetical protein